MAEELGIALSTVGNMECYPHKVIRRDRLERGLLGLGLDESEIATVLAAYDAAPTSAFAEKRREHFAKANAQRTAARKAGPLERALVRLLELRLLEGDACDCVREDRTGEGVGLFTCELCDAVRALGLGESWSPEIGEALSARSTELGVDNLATDSQHVNNPEDKCGRGRPPFLCVLAADHAGNCSSDGDPDFG